ncbi:MAG: Nif3-like dinuclear metal center hexameric protein [Armatimonadota bacterium]|jgi:putative NIF3 family GTP cyclohydrolase 1 type 2
MTANDLREHFLSRADWVDRETTVDNIIVGDPDRDVSAALVTWISSFAAVRAAVERGVAALITHEPTFYSHRNELDAIEESQIARQKKGFLDDSGLVILRIHDCWDRWPEIGIPWAWGRFLQLGDAPAAFGAARAQHRYDISPVTVDELARRIADKTGAIGEPSVQVVGEGAREVSRVGIGTGCICSVPVYVEMGCDVGVLCDDGASYWSRVQPAEDMDFPVIRVNHGTSEEPGMVSLTRYINDEVDGVTAEHLPHGSCFRLVGT